MKWYFASRTRHQDSIRVISDFLLHNNHSVTSHWIHKDTKAVQNGEADEMKLFADEIHEAVLQSDIFVLVSDPEGTDMFVELGIALAIAREHKGISIYIIGEHGLRSVMQHHPLITHVKSIEEIFDALDIEYSKFSVPDLT